MCNWGQELNEDIVRTGEFDGKFKRCFRQGEIIDPTGTIRRYDRKVRENITIHFEGNFTIELRGYVIRALIIQAASSKCGKAKKGPLTVTCNRKMETWGEMSISPPCEDESKIEWGKVEGWVKKKKIEVIS